MKNLKNLLTLSFLLTVGYSFGQSNSGLIARWKMNGNVNDASGNGHNGTAYGITPAAGITGAPNTAYSFDGTANSYISVPSSAGFNLFPRQSICAVIKPTGFYNGLCQGNFIVFRGVENSAGSFGLLFFDGPYNDCATMDTNKHVFGCNAGDAVATVNSWQCDSTGRVHTDHWYKVIATYDSTTYRIYVNGHLTTTIPNLPSSNASISDDLTIGKYLPGGTNYSYSFKGVMDDLRIYNRVLSDSEISHYPYDSLYIICSITGPETPYTQTNFSTDAPEGTASYKWSVNGTQYSTSPAFSAVAGVDFHNGDIVTLEVFDASATSLGKVSMTMAVTTSVSQLLLSNINLAPNPNNGDFIISGTANVKDYIVTVTDLVGKIIYSQGGSTTNSRLEHHLDLSGKLAPGIYLLQVQAEGQTKTMRFTKQ